MSFFYNRWVNASDEQKEELREQGRINSKNVALVYTAVNFITELPNGDYQVEVKDNSEVACNWKVALDVALTMHLGKLPDGWSADNIKEKTFTKAMKKRFGFSQNTAMRKAAEHEAMMKRRALIKAAAILKDKHPEAAAALTAMLPENQDDT